MKRIKVSKEIGCWCVYDYIFTPGIYEIDDERVIEAIKSEPRIRIIEESEEPEELEEPEESEEPEEPEEPEESEGDFVAFVEPVLGEVEIQKDEKLKKLHK